MKTLVAASFLLVSLAHSAWAQSPSAEVRKFLQFDDTVLALTHVRVIDGNGGAAQADRTIIPRDGKIEALGASPLPLPADARVLDLTGRTAIPGLVGMHN